MRRIIIGLLAMAIFLAFASHVKAQQNEKYSFKDFTDQSFKDHKAADFNNTTIVGSCFHQNVVGEEDVLHDIFPDGMTGVHFVRCNLDNVLIPPGNTMDTEGWDMCTNKRIKIQNDGFSWILDNDNKPVEPMDKEQLLNKGMSIDPEDIPAQKLSPEEVKARQDQMMGHTEQVVEP
jgi:hypothetical protein